MYRVDTNAVGDESALVHVDILFIQSHIRVSKAFLHSSPYQGAQGIYPFSPKSGFPHQKDYLWKL